MGLMRDERAAETLVSALNDENMDVVEEAGAALQQMGITKALEPII